MEDGTVEYLRRNLQDTRRYPVTGAGIEVANYMNNQYYATFLFGEKKQPINMMIDTGSFLTWVPTRDCPAEECTRHHFWSNISGSFKNHSIEETVRYGSGSVAGHLVSDMIYAEQQSPASPQANVNFIAAYSAANLTGLRGDGLIGLSPRTKATAGESGADSIIQKFYESGSISTPMFTLSFNWLGQQSKMMIGGYDEKSIEIKGTKRAGPADAEDMSKSDDGIFWMYINSNYYW